MAPENGGPQEKEIPIGNQPFSGSILDFRGVTIFEKQPESRQNPVLKNKKHEWSLPVQVAITT